MPTPDEMVRALRNERAYAGDHPILGRTPVVAPPPDLDRLAAQLGRMPPPFPPEPNRGIDLHDFQPVPGIPGRAVAAIASLVPGIAEAVAHQYQQAVRPLHAYVTGERMTPEEQTQMVRESAPATVLLVGPGSAPMAVPRGALGAGALVRYGAQAAEHAPFYSAAEKAIGEAGLSKAPLAQWLATLRNKGIKEEELNWLGLGKAPVGDVPNWQGHVTKDQLNDWVKGHGVQLHELQKGAGGVEISDESIGNLADQIVRERHPGIADTSDAYHAAFDNALMEAEDRLRGGVGGGAATKFQQYQLPGGSNYRETLLTLLTRDKPLNVTAKANERGTGWMIFTNGQRTGAVVNPPGMQLTEDQAVQIGRQSAEQNFVGRAASEEGAFRGSHWDEPNVLAHVRHNDRTLPPLGGDVDGGSNPRKALFMEELQSDWHQQGRKRGYQNPGQLGDGAQDFIRSYGPISVPDAPFKQTWPDLALKRMLAKAAHEGYDALAWTPGDVQAARYDLSKQVSKVQYHPEDQILHAYDLNNKNVIAETRVPPEKLPDYIGKDAAEKIMNDPTGVNGGYHELSGLDLKVGGEGMRAFYDKMLVDKANALGKRYGAKVQQEPIDSPLERREGPNADFGVSDEEWRSLTPEQKEAHDKQLAHVLPITPELREAAKKGFPLFAAGGVAAMGAAQENASTQPQERSGTADENQRMIDALRGQPGEL